MPKIYMCIDKQMYCTLYLLKYVCKKNSQTKVKHHIVGKVNG